MRRRALIPALVLGSSVSLAAQTPAATQTTVRGVVFDSLAMRGLAGATVQIAEATGKPWTKSAETDSLGAFELGGVPVGTYLVGFFHAKVDSLGLATTSLRVDVRTEQPIRLRLALPSTRTIARALCGQKVVRDSTGLLLAYLRGADNSLPRANGTVRVRWSEIIIEKKSIRRTIPSVDASSGATGLAAVCGVPLGIPVLLQGASGSDSSGTFEVTIPATGFLHRDVFVAPFTRATVSTDSAAVELLRGTARLRGRIVAATGRAIPGAHVMVWGTGLETMTNDDGAFLLRDLPGGTHTLDVRAVGFSPVQQPVDIVQDSPGATQIELSNLGITLDTVRVTAKRVYTSSRTAAFERRLKSSLGHIMLEDEIERRHPMFLTDLLRTVPGVRVVPSSMGADVRMRGGDGGTCAPQIILDGVRLLSDPSFPVDYLVSAEDIRIVEVYARELIVPAEFYSPNHCGVIVVWTGPRKKATK